MKGFLPLVSCCILFPGIVFGAGGGISSRNLYGDLNLNSYSSKKSGDIYIGLRGNVSFLNWKNEYAGYANDGTFIESGADSFKFKPVIGFDVFAGYDSNEKWRGDFEIGYVGKYSEKETEYYHVEEHTNFSLEVFYLSVNGYYDLWNGIYAGLGGGMAVIETSVDSSVVAGGSKTKVSPMVSIMFGWSHQLEERTHLDLRYRFSVFDAGSSTWNTSEGGWVQIDSGFIRDNSLSFGIRYSF